MAIHEVLKYDGFEIECHPDDYAAILEKFVTILVIIYRHIRIASKGRN
jgi:hypothetical protein